jgi:hypothetical protein
MANRLNKTPKYENDESPSASPPSLLLEAPAFAASVEKYFANVDGARLVAEEERGRSSFVLEIIT